MQPVLEHERACCSEFVTIGINLPVPQSGQACPDVYAFVVRVGSRAKRSVKVSNRAKTRFVFIRLPPFRSHEKTYYTRISYHAPRSLKSPKRVGATGFCRACGLSRGAALKPHRGFIHYRDQGSSLHSNCQKKNHPNGWYFIWQGQKDSNPQERFWRPLCYHYIMPLISADFGNGSSIAHRCRICQTNCER